MYQKGAILILGGPKMSLDFFVVVGGFVAVFLVFSLLYLREAPSWRVGAALVLIFVAVALAVSSE